MSQLKDYDIIIRMRTFHSIEGNIELCSNLLTQGNGCEKLNFDKTCLMNNLIMAENSEEDIKNKLCDLIKKYQGIFIHGKTKEFLPYNTNI